MEDFRMARIILIIIICAGVLIAGCSKKDEEIAQIENRVTDSIVQDSINRAREAMVADSIATAEASSIESEVDTYTNTDYSQYDGFVTQIGSYSDPGFADMIARKFQSRDYPAFVTSIDIEGVAYYRVRVGVYETIGEAKEIGELIKDRYSIEYWVDSNR